MIIHKLITTGMLLLYIIIIIWLHFIISCEDTPLLTVTTTDPYHISDDEVCTVIITCLYSNRYMS